MLLCYGYDVWIEESWTNGLLKPKQKKTFHFVEFSSLLDTISNVHPTVCTVGVVIFSWANGFINLNYAVGRYNLQLSNEHIIWLIWSIIMGGDSCLFVWKLTLVHGQDQCDCDRCPRDLVISDQHHYHNF